MMDNRKILVVLTGGTIGSAITDNTINVSGTSVYRLINEYYREYGECDDFVIEQPYSILSENTTLNTWNKLCGYLSDKDFNEYSGIIITHGTDTYSYTAALLGLLYDNCIDIPMVLVSSNYAIGEPQSNGLNNFANAVSFIRENSSMNEQDSRYKGVFCIYEDNFGVNCVYKAREIMEADTCTDQFKPFGGQYFGHIEGNNFVYNTMHENHCCTDLDKRFCSEKHKNVDKKIVFYKEVINIKSYPGLNYEYIDIEKIQKKKSESEASDIPEGSIKYPAAVLNNAYHSATVCVARGTESFADFAKRCSNAGIHVYINGFKRNLKDEYASLKELDNYHVTRLYDMSPEMAYAYVLVKENLL